MTESYPETIRVYLVDDESLARERLKRMLEQWPEYQLCGEAENGEQALAGIRETQPDIVLLDIRMPGMDGLQVAQHLSVFDPPPAIIFCTAYDEYAIAAFKYQAIGYLLKPTRASELKKALSQSEKLSRMQLRQLDLATRQSGEMFTANTWQGQELIPLDDIYFFRADQKYLTVIHREGETISDQTLKELEQQYTDRLLRCHRNTLVNARHIHALKKTPEGHYQLELTQSHLVPVSRRHVSEIKAALSELGNPGVPKC